MRICYLQKKEYFQFANEILNGDFDSKTSRCITSISNDGGILGVVVISRFSRHGCEINVASSSPRFISKTFIVDVANYIFNFCGKIRVTAMVNAQNIKSITLQRKLGFIEEATLKSYYGKDDGIIFRMLKEECKWIDEVKK